ncbi:MAG: hypothetical protein QXZ41_05240 [Ignisphaera sp.]
MVEEFINTLISVGKQIIAAIPTVLYAVIIVLVGYLIAVGVKVSVKFLFDKVLGRFFEKTVVGQRLKEAEVDLGGIIGTLVFALIILLSIMIAISALNIPGGIFIIEIIRIIINVIGGLLVISIGVPLAVLGAEYLAKLIAIPVKDKHETFQSIVSMVLSVLLIMFIFGIALAIMLGSIILLQMLSAALPAGVMAGVIIVIGYMIGDIVGRFIMDVIERLTKPVEETDIGKALKTTGIDLPILISNIVKATIIVLAIVVGLGMLGTVGIVSDILAMVSSYLPRILGAVILLTLGLILVLMLSKYIGKMFRAITKEKYEPLATLFENLIALGLIAAFIAIALNILGLLGGFVYAIIIGAIVISIGIMMAETMTKLLSGVHTTLDKLIPVVGSIVTLIFAYVGASAILAEIPGLTEVLKTIGWGIAIAFAIMLAPVVFYFIRIAWKEAESVK